MTLFYELAQMGHGHVNACKPNIWQLSEMCPVFLEEDSMVGTEEGIPHLGLTPLITWPRYKDTCYQTIIY